MPILLARVVGRIMFARNGEHMGGVQLRQHLLDLIELRLRDCHRTRCHEPLLAGRERDRARRLHVLDGDRAKRDLGALRSGADGFETDLRLLSDDTAVLFHDDEWRETEIETLAGDWIPQAGYEVARVRDLAKFANRGTMVLEVKRAKWEELLLSEIAGLPDIIVASFDHTLVAELARGRLTAAVQPGDQDRRSTDG